MEDFKIIQPTAMLTPYVKHYWILKTAGNPTALTRTVPIGMMSLIFHREAIYYQFLKMNFILAPFFADKKIHLPI